jgi:hypothetical protein
MPINAAGTRTEFEAVIDDLKGRLSSSDLLLIHTNNHGSHDGSQSCLCAYSSTYPYWSAYWASDFAAKLGELPQFRCLIVMMEQCHAGGFNADIIASSPADRTSVASACEELESSIGGWYFDPFARDWIAAVTGADPYGSALAYDPDTDGNGCISASEAFDYADTVKDPFDTPVFDASPADAGDCHLGQIYSELEAVIPKLYYEVVWRRIWPYRERMVDPEFYARVHKELVPRLREVEEIAGQRRKELGEELAPQIEEVVTEVFG